MAFQSNGPVMLALPPFRGVTRKIVLIALLVFVVQIVVGVVSGKAAAALTVGLILVPQLAFHHMPWQFATYGFLSDGPLNTAFALLAVWFFAADLEEERGGRWLTEYAAVSVIGGGLLAALLSYAHIPRIDPVDPAFGLWPLALALTVAFARRNPEAEIRLYFVLRVKAKYLVAIFLGIYILSAAISHDFFSTLVVLCVGLAGYLYLRLAPRRGLRYAASEGWFGVRNSFYRARRRRAAKKFTVYMKKQGKDVNLDPSGRYVDPDGNPRDPNDKRWMN
ncbi:MAG TPA: rhomboid family intramembrane serine protease [Acidobacteriaceae bacterium]|nr:rhomboid family intramembrane serine protease [Acidobacteriaceae bacterium]